MSKGKTRQWCEDIADEKYKRKLLIIWKRKIDGGLIYETVWNEINLLQYAAKLAFDQSLFTLKMYIAENFLCFPQKRKLKIISWVKSCKKY